MTEGTVRWGVMSTANIAVEAVIPAIQSSHRSDRRGLRLTLRSEARSCQLVEPSQIKRQ